MKRVILGIVLVINSFMLLLSLVLLFKSLSTPYIPEKEEELKVEKKVAKEVEKKEIVDYAIVKISSNPPGAKIFVNGYYKGRTPQELKIVSVKEFLRPYRFKLLLLGYRIWEDTIFLKKGDKKEYNINLIKE